MAKGSAKTHARSKKVRRRDGLWLDSQALKEHMTPKPVVVTYHEPAEVMRMIQESRKK